MSALRAITVDNQMPSFRRQDSRIEVVRNLTSGKVLEIARQSGLVHVIQEDGLEFESELRTARLMAESPLAFIYDPLSTIFGDQASELQIYSRLFEANQTKHELLNDMGEFLSALPRPRSILLQALSATDELYTNGAKNAWDAEQHPFKDRPVREGTVEFTAAASENRLVICCRDSFGMLNLGKLLERLSLCAEHGIGQAILHGTWGAGIGAYNTFESAVSYYAGVEPGRHSVVCVAMPIGIGQRQFDQLPKNLHLISTR